MRRAPAPAYRSAPTGRRCCRASPNPPRANRRSASSSIMQVRSSASVVSPAASTTPLNETRKFRALPRDRSRRRVTEDLTFIWELTEGEGTLEGVTDQEVEYRAPAVPGLARMRVTVTQREIRSPPKP